MQLWPAVTPVLCDEGQRCDHVNLCHSQRRLPDPPRLSGDHCPQLSKQSALDLHNFFLRIENLGFIFFELWRSEALGIDQGLLALVVARSEVEVGLADLDVVAED